MFIYIFFAKIRGTCGGSVSEDGRVFLHRPHQEARHHAGVQPLHPALLQQLAPGVHEPLTAAAHKLTLRSKKFMKPGFHFTFQQPGANQASNQVLCFNQVFVSTAFQSYNPALYWRSLGLTASVMSADLMTSMG